MGNQIYQVDLRHPDLGPRREHPDDNRLSKSGKESVAASARRFALGWAPVLQYDIHVQISASAPRSSPMGQSERAQLPDCKETRSQTDMLRSISTSSLSCEPKPRTPGVMIANRICARFSLLLYLATTRRVWSAIEQPASSVLKHIPFFTFLRDVLTRCDSGWDICSLLLVRPKYISNSCCLCYYSHKPAILPLDPSWMGLYGGNNAKPSYLMGCSC